MLEQWCDIPGHEGRYQASTMGRIRSTGTRNAGRVLKLTSRKRDGYQTVALHRDGKQTTYKVHRLVAATFLLNPDALPDVDHRDGVRSNNAIDNLRWASKSRNSIDRHKAHGQVPLLGVSRANSAKNPFRAHISVGRQQRHLGVFPTAEAAAQARAEAAKGVVHV